MTSYPGDKCPVCGAHEVPFKNPATKYACGSTDYDQRPGTFRQAPTCRPANEEALHE